MRQGHVGGQVGRPRRGGRPTGVFRSADRWVTLLGMMARSGVRRRLAGRDQELRTLVDLVEAARRGRGAALVIRGGFGSGRSALLEAVAARAPGFCDLHSCGVPGEAALPGAGLHRLLRPVAGQVDGLGEPHAEVLRRVVDGRGGAGADPLALGAAVLDLMAALTRDAPVLCRVDDADDLDQVSRAALAFAARRLTGHAVAMICAVDARAATTDWADLPPLPLDPLGEAGARALLADALAPHQPDGGLVETLVDLGHGNPLALVELAEALRPAQVRGADPPPGAVPDGSRLRRRFGHQVAALPEGSRRVVLLAAAAERLDVDTFHRVLARAGLSEQDADAAQVAGLLAADPDAVRLADPLARDCVYVEATLGERRAAHRVLAEVLDGGRHRLDRAWHRAAAGDGPRGDLADELYEAVLAVGGDGDHAACARVLERSAALTGSPAVAADRLVAAARYAWLAGRTRQARLLLRKARPLAGTAAQLGAVDLLHGEIELRSGTAEEAYEALGPVADGLAGPCSGLAVVALLRATEVSLLAGDHSRFLAMARRIGSARSPDHSPQTQLMFEHFAGLAAAYQGHHDEAGRPLRRVLDLAPQTHDPSALVLATGAAMTLGDPARALDLAARAVTEARAGPEAAHLPVALEYLAFAQFWADQYSSATVHALEGLHLARTSGQDNSVAAHLAILALLSTLHGDRDTVLYRARAAARQAMGRGLRRPGALTTWAVARLALATANAGDAVAALRAASAAGSYRMHMTIQVMATPDLVEAAARHGDRGWALAALTRFEHWAAGMNSTAMLALAARSRAVLASGTGEAEECLREALGLHTDGLEFERARTQLLYGRLLRRSRRLVAAREQLRDALVTFERLDALPWITQTRGELRAAGGACPTRPAPSSVDLTPQQSQIAGLVAAGATNREIAAQLFISPRTVEHHLRNIFAKLGLRSRVDLARLLTGEPAPPAE